MLLFLNHVNMSLDLDTQRKKGVTRTTTPILTNAFPAAGDFPAGEVATSHKLVAEYDTTAGPITLTLAAIVGVEEGDILTIQKVDATGNAITWTDPSTSITYSFVNQQGEFYNLTWDGAQWVAIV